MLIFSLRTFVKRHWWTSIYWFMKTYMKLPIVLLVISIFLIVSNVNAQNCGKSFYKAKVQYNSGQFKSTQNLLNACINSFDSNSNPDQVFKVYKLYISSCIKNKDKLCENTKRKQLRGLFPNKTEADIFRTLAQTKF